MLATVIGWSDIKVSQKGNKGGFIYLSFMDNYVAHGECCDRFWVDGNYVSAFPEDLKPGDHVEVAFNRNGAITSIKKVK